MGEEPEMNFRNLEVLLQICCELQANIGAKLVFFSLLSVEQWAYTLSLICIHIHIQPVPTDHMFYADTVLRGKGLEMGKSFPWSSL